MSFSRVMGLLIFAALVDASDLRSILGFQRWGEMMKSILHINSLLRPTAALHHNQAMSETPDLVLESKFTQQDLVKNGVKGGFYHTMDAEGTHIKVPFRVYRVELEPNFKIRPHDHPSTVMKFIARGSMTYNGKLYSAGDMLLFEQGAAYEGQAGSEGATIFMSRIFLYYKYD